MVWLSLLPMLSLLPLLFFKSPTTLKLLETTPSVTFSQCQAVPPSELNSGIILKEALLHLCILVTVFQKHPVLACSYPISSVMLTFFFLPLSLAITYLKAEIIISTSASWRPAQYLEQMRFSVCLLRNEQHIKSMMGWYTNLCFKKIWPPQCMNYELRTKSTPRKQSQPKGY